MALGPKADEIFRPIGAIQGIQSPLFAGRDEVVRSILGSIELSGEIPVIYGEKGVGKTSVAWRTFDILRQKDIDPVANEIANDFDLDESYIPLWVECGDWFAGIESALLALLLPKGIRQAVTIPDLFPDLISDEDRIRVKASFEFNLALFKAKTDLEGEERRSILSKTYESALTNALGSPIELFSQICSIVLKKYPGQTIVIFIDEFDRLPNKDLVGSVLKTLTGVRFVIVGVAKSTEELVGSHPSIDRKIRRVHVPPFDATEARQIFANASAIAGGYKGSHGISFSDKFMQRVFEDTGGYPNLIQKIGYHSIRPKRLNRRMFDEPVKVALDDYHPALKDMFRQRAARAALDDRLSGIAEDEIEVRLANAIADSSRRLAIIRELTNHAVSFVSVAELIAKLTKDDRQHLQANLDRLAKDGIIRRKDGDDEIAFASPVHLMAARLLLEAKE